jgi:two-component system LytT family response regulator
MKVIIIEDERPAAEKLNKAILQFDATIEVTCLLSSVQSAVEWFTSHPMPDLVFMDIELSDGLSFRIFDAVNITCPVIFTTAYDEYWQEAFEYNSIDYLLKPIREEKLASALKKFHQLQQHFSAGLQELMQWQKNGGKDPQRKRFLVKRGAEYITVRTEDIAYFYATHKLVCLVDKANRKFILDKSLAELEQELDSSQFYRVNRKYLVHLSSITKIRALPRSRLQLELDPALSEEVIISQENVSEFKQWMEG